MTDIELEKVQKIRESYESHEPSKLEELRALHKRVKRPAAIFAYIFGTAGALILGTGMCLAMKVIGDLMVPGIFIGLAGIAMVSVTHIIYTKLLSSRKARFKDEILALSDEITKSQDAL